MGGTQASAQRGPESGEGDWVRLAQPPDGAFANMPCRFISYHKHAASFSETCLFKLTIPKTLSCLGSLVIY